MKHTATILIVCILLSFSSAENTNDETRAEYHEREAKGHSMVYEAMSKRWDDNIRQRKFHKNNVVDEHRMDIVFKRAKQHAELAFYFSGIEANKRIIQSKVK